MSLETAEPIVVNFEQAPSSGSRMGFVDNLRWAMIVLVVSMHAAVTYSHLGSWYFMEEPKPGTLVMALFATYQIFLQAFFMGLLFMLAGYFVPGAYDRKGARRFLLDRAFRLGAPSLFFMLIIQPVSVYWLLHSYVNPSIPPLNRAYLPYLTSGRFLGGSGPMWFAIALLIFNMGYAMARLLRPRAIQQGPTPALPGHWQVLGLVLAMGFCSFLVRIFQPIGTNILNMQLCFFPQYVFLFVIGILARRRRWLERVSYQFGMRWFKLALTLGTVSWIGLLLALLATHSESKLGGGVTWQSAAFSFWEAFVCVGFCLGLLVLFREKFNQPGRFCRWLNENCFAVYVFHTPILIGVTLYLRGLAAPKPVKFICASVLGVSLTYLAVSLVFRRVPLLKRIL